MVRAVAAALFALGALGCACAATLNENELSFDFGTPNPADDVSINALSARRLQLRVRRAGLRSRDAILGACRARPPARPRARARVRARVDGHAPARARTVHSAPVFGAACYVRSPPSRGWACAQADRVEIAGNLSVTGSCDLACVRDLQATVASLQATVAQLQATPASLAVPTAAAAPHACNSSFAGRLYFSTTSGSLTICSGPPFAWTAVAASALGSTSLTPGTNCASIRAASPGAPSGQYWIVNGTVSYQTWCEMSADGGGWALAMRTRASPASVFTYAHSAWTDTSTYGAVSDLSPTAATDAKFEAFHQLAGTSLRLCFTHPSTLVSSCRVFPLKINGTLRANFAGIPAGYAALNLFNDPPPGPRAWLTPMGLVGSDLSSGVPPLYEVSGINVDDTLTCYSTRVRVGAVFNNQVDIATANDAAGMGVHSYCIDDCASTEVTCAAWVTGSGLASANSIFNRAGTLWVR
jgi:hypothetical protein